MQPVATELERSPVCRETLLIPHLTCPVKTSHFNGQEHHESPVTEEGTGYLGVGGRRGMRTQICGHLSQVEMSVASLKSPPKPGERQKTAQKPMDNFILISPREDNF